MKAPPSCPLVEPAVFGDWPFTFPPMRYLHLLLSLSLLLLKHETGALRGSPIAPGPLSSPASCILCLQGGCEPRPGEKLEWLVLKRSNPADRCALAMPPADEWARQASSCHRPAKEEPPVPPPTPASSPTLGLGHQTQAKPLTAGLLVPTRVPSQPPGAIVITCH